MTTQTQAIELLPCPFCDGTSTLQHHTGRYSVWCDKCHISTAWGSERDVIISEWNRRATASIEAPTSEPVRGASIDTPEFRKLLADLLDNAEHADWRYQNPRDALIAHINAWHASQIAAALSEGRKQGAARSAATYSEYIASQSASVEDARDAARYRFVKADNARCEPSTFCLFFDDEDQSLNPVENMDADIDAAIAAMTKATKKGGA